MIGIRVDVNQVVATGHIKRCLSIALNLRKMGQECLFISADDRCLAYLKPHGFCGVVLDTPWDNWDLEIEKTVRVIKEHEIHSLLVDSYLVTEKFMQEVIKHTKVTYFDELFLCGYGCQQLINGVLCPPDYADAPGKAFAGPAYVSLREEFTNMPKKNIRQNVERILLTTGGTDNYHFCRAFLEFFLAQKRWEQVHVVVAVGELCVDKEFLQDFYKDNPRVEIHVNADNMSRLFMEADYAVSAGGTALYEMCAAGVAGSSFAIGDNQVENAKNFGEKGYVSYAGDFRAEPEATLRNVLEQLKEAASYEFRAKKAERLQQLVDGRGAVRIAEVLMNA